MDLRLKILEQARSELALKGDLLDENLEVLQSLLDLLSQAIKMSTDISDKEKNIQDLGKQLIDSGNLLLSLKQHADELNALRRISINLTPAWS